MVTRVTEQLLAGDIVNLDDTLPVVLATRKHTFNGVWVITLLKQSGEICDTLCLGRREWLVETREDLDLSPDEVAARV